MASNQDAGEDMSTPVRIPRQWIEVAGWGRYQCKETDRRQFIDKIPLPYFGFKGTEQICLEPH